MKNKSNPFHILYTYKHSASIETSFKILILVLIFLLPIHAGIAKSNPTTPITHLTTLQRAQSLDNGISISWYEQTWNDSILSRNPLKSADFKLLKALGYKSIRLPVAFNYFESHQIPIEQIFSHIDIIVKQCALYGLKLIICYHSGDFNENNYLTETPRIANLWVKLAKRYYNKSPDNLFFEIYNEPLHMNPQVWKDAAFNIVNAIRKIDKQRTLIVGASNYNSIYELSRFVPLADDNIIYTFHFYEPFLFTHQGAEWVGNQEATVGVPFPYNAQYFPILSQKAKGTDGEKNYSQYPRDGNEQSVRDKLQIIKNWRNKYNVALLCGEYGVYNKYADLNSRCRYIKTVRQTLKTLNIPGMLWDYNGSFSVFDGTPSIKNLPDCMKDAIGYHAPN